MDTEHNARLFWQWILDSGRAEGTAKKYCTSIRGSLSTWAKDGNLIEDSLFSYTNSASVSELAGKIRELEIFKARNASGNGMTHHALKAYEQYCQESANNSILKDINSILEETDTETERQRLIAARLGQGEFRNRLITLWGSCSVTGFKLTKLLVASHIKP